MRYDDTYGRTENVFGPEAEPALQNYYHKMNKSMPVLDIGAGQGRNSRFLARNGYMVDAIDPSKVAVDTITTIAVQERLLLYAYQCDFDNFVPLKEFYCGILIFGLIQILPRKSIELLLTKVKQWTDEESLVFVTAFSVADPSFSRLSQTWKCIGKTSFADEQGNIRTYLETDEILNLFDEYEAIHHWEGIGPEHRHGNGPPERHAMIEAVFKR